MLRLTGLANVARFPRTTVQRREERFGLLFHGGEDSTRMEVEFRYLGPREDPELVELELLARLQQLGYHVERRAPEDEPKG